MRKERKLCELLSERQVNKWQLVTFDVVLVLSID